MPDISEIRDYWEDKTPQHWYSKKSPGTREYYDEIQEYRYSKAYPYLPELAEFATHGGKKVLEVGCGQGTDLYQFAKNGAEVTGIDLTEGAVNRSRELFAAYDTEARLETGNAESLAQFSDNTFDVVYSFGVLHHTPNTGQCFESIHRVLKPGGKAYIMVYAKGLNYLIKFSIFHVLKGGFLRGSFQDTINRNTEYQRNSPLTKMYSKKEGRQLAHLFRNLEVKKLHNPTFSYLLPRFVDRPLGAIIGDNLFIRGTK
jgi:ubiquinone/menaquinone biosynthesis C-methylase UbiE